MLSISRIVTLFLSLLSTAGLAAPPWANDKTVKHIRDKIIVVTCQAQGLARDLAYANALRSCAVLAAEEVNSEFQSKSVVIETETQSAKLYSEISSQKQVKGLKPKTQREATEPSDDGFVAFLQVEYDLNNTVVTSVRDEASDPQDHAQGHSIETPLRDNSSPEIKKKKSSVGSERTLTITMLPEKCSDYLIQGKRPRSQSCGTNPLHIMVNVSQDILIILRPASSAFLPKTLKVHKQREPASDYDNEVIDVVFERK